MVISSALFILLKQPNLVSASTSFNINSLFYTSYLFKFIKYNTKIKKPLENLS